MTGPNLAQARATAGSVFNDRIRITRDSEGVADDWRDEATGTSVPSTPVVVYEGPCMFRPGSVRARPNMEGEAVIYDQEVRVRIPVDAPAILLGDVCTVLASTDTGAVGVTCTVTRVDSGTFAVTRILTCTVENRGPDL